MVDGPLQRWESINIDQAIMQLHSFLIFWMVTILMTLSSKLSHSKENDGEKGDGVFSPPTWIVPNWQKIPRVSACCLNLTEKENNNFHSYLVPKHQNELWELHIFSESSPFTSPLPLPLSALPTVCVCICAGLGSVICTETSGNELFKISSLAIISLLPSIELWTVNLHSTPSLP